MRRTVDRASAGTEAPLAILHAKDPADVLSAYEQLHATAARALNDALAAALYGSPRAAEQYAELCRGVVRTVLATASDLHPELLVSVDGSVSVLDSEGEPAPFAGHVLELGALDAPFSPWVARFGPGPGVVLSLVSRVRSLVRGLTPLMVEEESAELPHWETFDSEKLARFRALVEAALERRQAQTASLARVKRLFGLSLNELARLFGVSRQAVTRWIEKGVPVARQAKLQTVAAIAELLERQLKAMRLPGVVRRPAARYGGLSILEMIEADRDEEVLAELRQAFDWAATA